MISTDLGWLNADKTDSTLLVTALNFTITSPKINFKYYCQGLVHNCPDSDVLGKFQQKYILFLTEEVYKIESSLFSPWLKSQNFMLTMFCLIPLCADCPS